MAHRTGAGGGAWAPFVHPAFRNLWLAQLAEAIDRVPLPLVRDGEA